MRMTNEGLAVVAAALSVRADHPSQSRRRSTPAARHGARARRALLPRRLLRRPDELCEG